MLTQAVKVDEEPADAVIRPMSKRILGLGIIAAGLLVLAVALIMGLEFPRFIYRKNVDDMCISSPEHKKYNIWVLDEYRTRYNRIYYWTITNVNDFLYSGQTPTVKQKGPYIYREQKRKLDVKFSGTTVSFRDWKRQTFDAEKTAEECGTCTEHENLEVLNLKFFHLIGEFNTDINVCLWFTRAVINETLLLISKLSNYTMTNIVEVLGGKKEFVHNKWKDALQYPNNFSNLGFGSWIYLNDTSYKSDIIKSRNGFNFTYTEMRGLYDALLSQELLGASKTALTNQTFKNICTMGIVNSDRNDAYAVHGGMGVNKTNYVTGRHSSATTRVQCGLIVSLEKFHASKVNGDSEVKLRNLTNFIQEYLCTNSSNSCLLFPNGTKSRISLVTAIYEYIFTHLTKLVLHKAVIVKDYDMVVTRRQSELALGSFASNSSFYYRQSRGILEHFNTADEARKHTKWKTLSNCYGDGGVNNNFRWLQYEGLFESTSTQFPHATAEERRVKGLRYNLQPVQDLNACWSYHLKEEAYEFFMPEFWRRFSYHTTHAYWYDGIYTTRLRVNKSTFHRDGRFMMQEGLQEMTGTNMFLSWLSLPHFLYASKVLIDSFFMKPVEEDHTCHIDVEPITGTVMGEEIRYQQNIGIKKEYFQAPRAKVLMLNYTDMPVPVYWMERAFTFNKNGTSDFRFRIYRLMSTSCGGLIGLSIVAALVVLTGLFCACFTIKNGRVAPMDEGLSLT